MLLKPTVTVNSKPKTVQAVGTVTLHKSQPNPSTFKLLEQTRSSGFKVPS